MDVISTIIMPICLCQKFVPVPHNIMGYHTKNVYHAVVINDPVLVYLTIIKIKMQKTRVQQ